MAIPLLVWALPAAVAAWAFANQAQAEKKVANVPNYAQPSKWPTTEGLDPGLTGLSLQTVVEALEQSRDINGIREAAGIMDNAGFPIAATKLRAKAAILERLLAENHWIMAGETRSAAA